MTPEQQQPIRDLFNLPPSTEPSRVQPIFTNVKTFLHAASSANATKPLTQACLAKLNIAGENTSASPPPTPEVEKPTPPPSQQKEESTQQQQQTQSSAAPNQEIHEQLPPLSTGSQLPALSNLISGAIALLILVTIVFGYNKFVVAPEKKRQEIAAQQEEKRQKYKREAELTAQQEAEKRAECDREQASLAGIVANKELSRQQRYQAYKDADPNGLPLVPTFPQLRRELKDIQEKIDMLESPNLNAIDLAIGDLQRQINKDQSEADRLNEKAGGVLPYPAAGRHSHYTEGYNEYHAFMSNIASYQRKINELYALKENPQANLDKLKNRRSQIQIELGPN